MPHNTLALSIEQLDNGLIRVVDRSCGLSGCYHPDGSHHSGDLDPSCQGGPAIQTAVRAFLRRSVQSGSLTLPAIPMQPIGRQA